MSRITLSTMIAAALCHAAAAQSFNIDIGLGAAPADTYAAAGLPGHWMKLPGTQGEIVFNLVDIDGNVTNARMSQFGGTETLTVKDRDLTGDDATLMNDFLITHTIIENCLFFNDMEEGEYEVIIYARMPAQPKILAVTNCDQEPGNPHLLVGGEWPGQHEEGVSFAVHDAIVTANGQLYMHSGVPAGGSLEIGAALNAVQIRKLEAVVGDTNGDGIVDIFDLLNVLAAWGLCDLPCPPSCTADFDGDCRVGILDLLTLLANWG